MSATTANTGDIFLTAGIAVTGETTMRKTFAILGATLIAAATIQTAAASDRHHGSKAQPRPDHPVGPQLQRVLAVAADRHPTGSATPTARCRHRRDGDAGVERGCCDVSRVPDALQRASVAAQSRDPESDTVQCETRWAPALQRTARALRCVRGTRRSMRQRRRPPSAIVIPRAGGESSTPRPLGSITAVSGMLDRPVKPGDDSECCRRTNGRRADSRRTFGDGRAVALGHRVHSCCVATG